MRESLEEMKSLFITALVTVQTCPAGAHTLVWEDQESHKEMHAPLATFVKSLVHYGAALERAMGRDEFYTWLDRFMHATQDEKVAMWENGGKWAS